MLVSGVSVAIIENDTILLTLREDFEVWCLPGGEIEEDESIADAARREVREETGLEVELTRLVGVYSRVGWRPLHNFHFAARVVGGTLTPQQGEILEARFFPLDALPAPEHLSFGQRHKIEDAISGATGVVKTEYVSVSDTTSQSRAEIYQMRDQSGLSRREFYRRNIPPLPSENIVTEIAGVPGSP